MSPLFEHLLICWRQCLRGHALIGVGVMGVVICLAGWLFASFSLRQPLVVGVDVSFSGIRALGAFLVLLWVQEAFVRDIERKTVLAVFAFPAERSVYVAGRFAGVILLVLAALAIWGGGVYVLGMYGSWGYAGSSAPELGWALILALIGLWLDLLVIGAFMLFVVSVSHTRLLPLFMGLCFALAARGIGPVLEYLRQIADTDEKVRADFLPVLESLRWVLPDLAALDWRAAMLYGRWPAGDALLNAGAGAIGYAVVLLAMAVMVYQRREFT